MKQANVLPHPPSDTLEPEILKQGRTLWDHIRHETPGLFNIEYWHGQLMDWAMKDPSFKTDLFRFVDVLPALKTTDQVTRHVREYLIRDGRDLPAVITMALKAAGSSFTGGLASMAIRKNVTDMAERFIVGTNPIEATRVLKKLHSQGIGFTADLLGEATVSCFEADACQKKYLDLISHLSSEASSWPGDEVIDRNHLGPIPRVNISLKISALDAQWNVVDPVCSVERLTKRVLPILLLAKEKNVFINFDLEQWELHRITYDLFEALITTPELKGWPHLGIVVQGYLKSSRQDIERLISVSKKRGTPFTIRLVKGAYWDFEVVHARQLGYEIPVFMDKGSTDANYEKLSRLLLDNTEHLHSAFGSHNLRSLVHAIVYAEHKGLPKNAYEIQMLHGMAESERKVLRANGHRLRVYSPVGELLPGMAYLVRRLLENTSNNGFLRLSFQRDVAIEKLLQAPRPQNHEERKPSAFENCPLTDFTNEFALKDFSEAIETVARTLPRDVPIVIDGERRTSERKLKRESPSDLSNIVSIVNLANVKDADEALEIAKKNLAQWRERPISERSHLLEKLADRLEADRYQLSALQIHEVGKTWKEADADVAEAIDFCRYYARQTLIELSPQKLGNVAGEDNRFFYEGRGVTLIIAPWNFPLAILCGMTTAALVAGNTVIMKPSEQSSAVAFALFEHLVASGFPSGVVQFLPGEGSIVGAHLVAHPDVVQIAFTGSREVGLSILKKAGEVAAGQDEVKHVVCEMGGKNAIIVDDDADLDQAVAGVVQSAYGYAGQKCSACSRAVVLESAYDAFVGRLVEATSSLLVGPSVHPQNFMGPVIDRDAYERLMTIVSKEEVDGAKRIHMGKKIEGGYFVPPTIFEVKDPKHHLMQDELFGPVLAIMKVKTFEEALAVANQTPFALTGAVYSRTPSHLDRARREFRVGNLYFNRGSTGALVHRQPFGGFKMSGLGTKAGGPGYLLQLVNPRVVTENTMRCGFTTDEVS